MRVRLTAFREKDLPQPMHDAPAARRDPATRLDEVLSRIAIAARAVGRDPAEIQLVAVSKTRSADDIRALAAAGATAFGENYLQEALTKQSQLKDLPICWHFIGAIQTNKTRSIAENFDWVHSADRLRVLERLAVQRPPQKGPLNVCLQVNLDAEAGKAGLVPDAVAAVLAPALELSNLAIRGLMAIPAPRLEDATRREPFRRLADLARALEAEVAGARLDVLSMGMSDDLEAAVAEGATHVRVGSALFGPRAAGNADAERQDVRDGEV